MYDFFFVYLYAAFFPKSDGKLKKTLKSHRKRRVFGKSHGKVDFPEIALFPKKSAFFRNRIEKNAF